MGLLDDAIREHLDLKRARGGDPTEIERMEREALGPVRREPTIGSAHVEVLPEHASPLESGLHEERPAGLEEPTEHGYHGSTAARPSHDHAEGRHASDDEQFERHEPGAPFIEEAEQPRRRFLRRNRQSGEPVLRDPGLHDDALAFDHPEHHDNPVEYEGPLAQDDPLEHQGASYHAHAPLEQPPGHTESEFDPHLPEQRAPEQRDAQDESRERSAPQEPAAQPPHLQFDSPPKRPRFTPEPPELRDASSAPAAPPPDDDDSAVETQETTEFDVERHIAETRNQPDEEPTAPTPAASPASPATPAQPEAEEPEKDEDVLEETPEFLQDTPEHDRLWFEQRPPKDFDFDG